MPPLDWLSLVMCSTLRSPSWSGAEKIKDSPPSNQGPIAPGRESDAKTKMLQMPTTLRFGPSLLREKSKLLMQCQAPKFREQRTVNAAWLKSDSKEWCFPAGPAGTFLVTNAVGKFKSLSHCNAVSIYVCFLPLSDVVLTSPSITRRNQSRLFLFSI